MLLASAAEWAPARWPAADPASLALLDGSPVNCLLVEEAHWSAEFNAAAKQRGMITLAVLHARAGAVEAARKALTARPDGLVLEGEFEASAVKEITGLAKLVIELPYRSSIRESSPSPVAGSFQGVWPGINIEDGKVKAAPTGAPWIDTNAGFLRYLRETTSKPVWISNLPPHNAIIPVERYLQAIGDAHMSGGRWVLAFEEDFWRRLLARNGKALEGWKRINGLLAFLETHKEWRAWRPAGQMAVIQDIPSGVLLSGGVLDMVVVKHTPVRPVPYGRISADSFEGAKLAVNVDPAALNEAQKAVVKGFTSGGGTVLSAPPGWRFPPLRPGQITLDKQDVGKLDEIWRELNWVTGRRNLGARLFNVSSMLSNLLTSPDGKRLLLYLVNYSNYPAEAVTVHLLGKWNAAVLHAPGVKPAVLAPYAVEEGTGIDVEFVNSVAALVIE
jgi:hypothetical protein